MVRPVRPRRRQGDTTWNSSTPARTSATFVKTARSGGATTAASCRCCTSPPGGNVSDYYLTRFPADGERCQGGRRVGDAVEWARVRGTVVREDARQVVVVLDADTFTFDQGTERVAQFDLR